MDRSHILDLFVGTVFDLWARHSDQSVRWARAKTPTRERWLLHVAASAAFAQSTQFSPLAREPLANPPDRDRMLALRLSSLVQEMKSRATTCAGLRKSRRASAAVLDTFWLPAVRQARAAVEAWIAEQAPGEMHAAGDALAHSQLLLPPGRALDLSEAPY